MTVSRKRMQPLPSQMQCPQCQTDSEILWKASMEESSRWHREIADHLLFPRTQMYKRKEKRVCCNHEEAFRQVVENVKTGTSSSGSKSL